MAKAKQVYTVEYIMLQDGTEVEVKPLPIKRLKKAQALINDAINVNNDEDETEDNDEENSDTLLDAFIDVTLMVMQGQEKCLHFTEPDEGRDRLEDNIDQETLYEIVKVSTGYDFLAVRKRMEALMEKEYRL